MPRSHVRAEWVRAFAFVLAAAALALMAFAHPRDQTAVWTLGLAATTIALAAILRPDFAIESGRAYFVAVVRRRPAAAIRALVDLGRTPAAPAPHRAPRLIAAVFGPLSAAAGLVMIVRLATV